jgi:hypothetical protein
VAAADALEVGEDEWVESEVTVLATRARFAAGGCIRSANALFFPTLVVDVSVKLVIPSFVFFFFISDFSSSTLTISSQESCGTSAPKTRSHAARLFSD